MTKSRTKLAFVSSDAEDARAAAAELVALHGQATVAEADVVVALGGDGFLLQTLRETMSTGKLVYGMNRGTIGFLMNEFRAEDLRERIADALPETIRPLEMETETAAGEKQSALAINEVALWRQSYQTAKIRITIDGHVRLDELHCDGVMVATPAGSTAYNLSAYGPILPLEAPLLALTPVSPFRPRRWRGALLSNRATVRFDMLEPGYGYLRISQFSETTGTDTLAAIRALEDEAGGTLRGLVLDLRNNPGGVLDAAVEVSDAFLEDGTIVSAEGRSAESRFRMEAMEGDLARGAAIAVLVNEGSASAAEIVAGALRDNGRAKLLGRKTFGKGSVQTVMPLEDGQALKLTTSHYFTPSGVSIHERGLEPDVPLPEPEAIAAGAVDAGERDPEIRAAIAFLKTGKTQLVSAE
jgi:NAD+ kinase